jgi:nucleoside-diphosphate-sugar epimerase
MLREPSMTNARILVTGATGKTGSLAAAELHKAGYPVRAMVHREDARSARLRALGAEIAVITPLSPGFDLDRYDRELRRPLPSEPQLAPQSTIWRREHATAFQASSIGWNY